tara:strand:- start:7041 stop:7904 length:864 start_codon:yes stop_codon:yes gene_type:complete
MEISRVKIEADLFFILIKILKKTKNRKFLRHVVFSLIYYLSFNHRISLGNIKMAFPGKNRKEVKELNKKSFFTALNHFVDFLNAEKINKENLDDHFTIKNYHYLESAFKKGNGAIITSAHFGNFLITGLYSPFIFKGKKVYDVIDVDCSPKLRKKMINLLSLNGLNLIGREDWKKCYDVLKNNDVFILVADPAIGNRAVTKVNFFNKKISYPIGPALVGYKSKAQIIPTFTVSKGSKYEVIFEKPLKVDYSKGLEYNIKNTTQQWANLLEKYIRNYPEQYFWRLRFR